MRRIATFTALAGVLLLAPGTSRAATGMSQGCAAFPWVQTYKGWGPAGHYGQRVTVVYAAETCAEAPGSLEVAGTATVHRGGFEGEVVDQQPFTNSVTWTGDAFEWWGCVDQAVYAWEIPGVYGFRAEATAGQWSLVVSPGRDGTLNWSHQGC